MKPLFLHLAHARPQARLWTASFQRELAALGELEIVPDAAQLPPEEVLARARSADVLITGWGSLRLPEPLVEDRGRVRYVCHLTGHLRDVVPLGLIQAGVPVTNWGDAPAFGIAEGAITLLLASLKNLRGHIEFREGGPAPARISGSLENLRVGVYGMGRIARRFCQLLQPFGCRLSGFDPYVQEWPESVERVPTLEALFGSSDAIVIHAGLNEHTRGSVNASLLRLLPDHGIVVNTARGDIIDQEALFAEVAAGRLRAGIDVLAGRDYLPPEHPAHSLPGLILTHHSVGSVRWPAPVEGTDAPLTNLHKVCLANLRAFLEGGVLQFVIDVRSYELST